MGGTDRGGGPASDPYAAAAAVARAELVREMTAHGRLSDPALHEAFAAVPRHLFVPHYVAGPTSTASGGRGAGGGGAGDRTGAEGPGRLWRDDPDPRGRERWLTGAYADVPLATRVRDGDLLSSSSQPSLMATMLAALDLQDGNRVLEIGAGTGYNAALLAHRLGDDRVTSIDLDPEIVESARGHLAAAGYHPTVLTGDGARGCLARAPYDRIIATCALTAIPTPWLAQCRPGALILAPLATGLIKLRVYDARRAEGRFLDTPAYFVPLRGSGTAPPVRTGDLARRHRDDPLVHFVLRLTAGHLEPHEALELWERAGRPGRGRFGLTVGPPPGGGPPSGGGPPGPPLAGAPEGTGVQPAATAPSGATAWEGAVTDETGSPRPTGPIGPTGPTGSPRERATARGGATAYGAVTGEGATARGGAGAEPRGAGPTDGTAPTGASVTGPVARPAAEPECQQWTWLDRPDGPHRWPLPAY